VILLVALLAAIAAQVPPDDGASAADVVQGRLCGRDANNNEALLAEIRQRPSVRALQDDGEFIQLVDPQERMIWTFTIRGHPAYPAISCSEWRSRGGQIGFRQSLVCNGAGRTECTDFFLINRARNNRIRATISAMPAPVRSGDDGDSG
jgi:hypothetical protein